MAYQEWQLPTGFDFEQQDKTTRAVSTRRVPPARRVPPTRREPIDRNHPNFLRSRGLIENSKKSFKQLRADLNEGIGISADIMAPAMLILKRRGIRVYPDGQRVALYHNDRFNMIFPVPFGPSRLNISNSSAPISGFTK